MSDLLVSLYCPGFKASEQRTERTDITIRPVLAPERHVVLSWIQRHFSDNWASEAAVAIGRQPSSCLIALNNGELVGFACYDAIARGFFGPTGVAEASRGEGIGTALLHRTLQAMKDMGYAYAIIGDPGPTRFYIETVGAIEIPVAGKGIYSDMLRTPKPAARV
ncbi:GNAT family N-acetyltransferase [Microvirga lotononidis]|uniref:Putative acetyltransferase n=1 Tax=Microvirga lotononidis TaxID=864069 RepID=I4Z2U9_9HYPH|nr:GNAT family N-acetyltransferase [Microvirga lotononidis]EIM30541.1 putative acetyltransferase [Microvirga lotononidis]WQO26372.1 GNAT family N-acetyltransferase [Microvirga lotononidis]